MLNNTDISSYKQEVGFNRLLTEMSATYVRHGRTYGAVRLANPTPEEEQAISAFFERDYFNQAMIRISLGDFERQLAKVSPGIKFGALLAEYSEHITPDKRSAFHKNKHAFVDTIEDMLPKYKNTPAEPWLNDIATQMRRTYKPWVEQFITEPDKVINTISKVAEILINLPPPEKLPIRLSTFAAKFIDCPYQLEFAGEYGLLFVRALAYHFGTPIPHSPEAAIELYLKAGLLANDVLCQVMVQNIKAYKPDGKPDKICEIYNKCNQVHVLTLENIAGFVQAKSTEGKVYVIENPQVFAAVREQVYDKNYTLISPVGNHNPGFLRLLDLLCATGSRLYYAGNMDYKGLINADALYLQFGKQFIPWRYSKADYELMLTKNSGLLPDDKKELAMHNEDLALILSQMRKTGKAANTMAIVPLLVDDILNGGAT